MKQTYLAPKNDKTILLSKNMKNFDKFIDKYKKDSDCIELKQIQNSEIDKVIIYSPQYYKEIYGEISKFIPSDKIRFFLFNRCIVSYISIVNIYYEIHSLFEKIKKKFRNLLKKSETSKVRDSLSIYCQGNGLDIGFGGDPIVKTAITIDLPNPYAKYEKNPHHLKGSGDNLYWFRNDVLDYVYSSHLLEDFEDTEKVVNEWLRVIKPNGYLVLFLPNEILYREYCYKNGNKPNQNHIHLNFSLEYIKNILQQRKDVKIIKELEPSNIYSFELVIQKLG